MTEHPIDDLLAPLTGPVDPDPDFDARLRALLEAELDAPRARRTRPRPRRLFELEAIADVPTTRWPSWRPFALAAAVLAIVAAAAIVTTRGDDGSTVVDAHLAPSSTPSSSPSPSTRGRTPTSSASASTPGCCRWRATSPASTASPATCSAAPRCRRALLWWSTSTPSGWPTPSTVTSSASIPRPASWSSGSPPASRSSTTPSASRCWRGCRVSSAPSAASPPTVRWSGSATAAGRVLRIDPETNEVVGSLDVSVRPDLVRVEGDHLLVANLVSGEAQVIDTDSGDEVITVPGTSDDLAGAALHGGALFLQDASEGVVTRVDLETGATITSESLGESLNRLSQPTLPTGLAVSDAGVLVDTADEPDSLHVLDAVTLRGAGHAGDHRRPGRDGHRAGRVGVAGAVGGAGCRPDRSPAAVARLEAPRPRPIRARSRCRRPSRKPRCQDGPVALTDRDRAILDFERTWWSEPGPKETAIRERFELSPTRYYELLNETARGPRGHGLRPARRAAAAPVARPAAAPALRGPRSSEARVTSPRRARAGRRGRQRHDGLTGGGQPAGGILIAVAVVLGVVLLGKGFDSGFIALERRRPERRGRHRWRRRRGRRTAPTRPPRRPPPPTPTRRRGAGAGAQQHRARPAAPATAHRRLSRRWATT